MVEPHEPTSQFVGSFVNRFQGEQLVNESALEKLFRTFPKNTAHDEVILKVVALNHIYATNIYSTGSVAAKIVECDIDDKLQRDLLDVVEEIAVVNIKGKLRRNYSFASKYCAWHRPETYPIYDWYVDNLLWRYQKSSKFSAFKRNDLWYSYPQFTQAINDFRSYYGLHDFSIKQLDSFLWLYGKGYYQVNTKVGSAV